jgi:excisionase family DNA binding protein
MTVKPFKKDLAADVLGASLDTRIVPFDQRLTCAILIASLATGISRSKIYELIGSGEIETVKIGRRRLVLVRSLLRLMQSRSQNANGPATPSDEESKE